MDRDTINLLYLELSQFCTAITRRELILMRALEKIANREIKSMNHMSNTARKALAEHMISMPK